MILHEFPDLGWLKQQIATGFRNRKGWGNGDLLSTGFPSVIVHVQSGECYRPDVRGPVSLFLNLRGTSFCSVDGQRCRIGTDHFFVTNQAQHYTLEIEKDPGRGNGVGGTVHGSAVVEGKQGMTTETFNIHFGEDFAGSLLHALVTPADKLLDHGAAPGVLSFGFFNHLQRRTPELDGYLRAILRTDPVAEPLLFQEQLTQIMTWLLGQHRENLVQMNRLPVVRSSTRTEIYRRLTRATDRIHDSPWDSVSLESLAQEACLSRFHFLRLFRQTFGLTPHQYIQDLRLEKARDLLTSSDLPVMHLSEMLGFANPQSFSRLFHQRTGRYPTQYREEGTRK